MFLIIHQGLLGENSDSEEDSDVLDWLGRRVFLYSCRSK